MWEQGAWLVAVQEAQTSYLQKLKKNEEKKNEVKVIREGDREERWAGKGNSTVAWNFVICYLERKSIKYEYGASISRNNSQWD